MTEFTAETAEKIKQDLISDSQQRAAKEAADNKVREKK